MRSRRTWIRTGIAAVTVALAALAAAFSLRTFGPETDWNVFAASTPTPTATHTPTETPTPTSTSTPTPTATPTPEPTATTIPEPQPPAVPGPEVLGERWVDVDLSRQTATAMLGDRPLYTALVTTGKDGWGTPTGTFYIQTRIENETMTSAAIGAEEYYVLEDVLYTQYFTGAGHALHLNWWRDSWVFGTTRSSHGCVGMRYNDALFFWNFAHTGTRIAIHGDGSSVPSI